MLGSDHVLSSSTGLPTFNFDITVPDADTVEQLIEMAPWEIDLVLREALAQSSLTVETYVSTSQHLSQGGIVVSTGSEADKKMLCTHIEWLISIRQSLAQRVKHHIVIIDALPFGTFGDLTIPAVKDATVQMLYDLNRGRLASLSRAGNIKNLFLNGDRSNRTLLKKGTVSIEFNVTGIARECAEKGLLWNQNVYRCRYVAAFTPPTSMPDVQLDNLSSIATNQSGEISTTLQSSHPEFPVSKPVYTTRKRAGQTSRLVPSTRERTPLPPAKEGNTSGSSNSNVKKRNKVKSGKYIIPALRPNNRANLQPSAQRSIEKTCEDSLLRAELEALKARTLSNRSSRSLSNPLPSSEVNNALANPTRSSPLTSSKRSVTTVRCLGRPSLGQPSPMKAVERPAEATITAPTWTGPAGSGFTLGGAGLKSSNSVLGPLTTGLSKLQASKWAISEGKENLDARRLKLDVAFESDNGLE